jgi:hypothetical protein
MTKSDEPVLPSTDQQNLLGYATKRLLALEKENETLKRENDGMRRLLTAAHDLIKPFRDCWQDIDEFFNPEDYD